MVIVCNIFADSFAQRKQSEVGGITGSAAVKGVDGIFTDRPRCYEIRFSDAERDHIIHLVDQFKKITDAAFGQFCDMFRQTGAWARV